MLKNVNGFFLLEECRLAWQRNGNLTEYEELLAAAEAAPAHASVIDPDAAAFSIDGEMPEKIADYCCDTDQRVPESEGEIVRCLLDSLAATAALTLEEITTTTGRTPETLHVGGGGVRNELFCQLLADATGLVVRAGTGRGNRNRESVDAGGRRRVASGPRNRPGTRRIGDGDSYVQTGNDRWMGRYR